MDEVTPHKYSVQQKIGFTMLLIFGILIIVLGFLQMRNTIYTPFVIRASDLADPLNSALFENDQVKLQNIDTDHDGLNDYEELNFFGTSPYLPDTDSDGIDDKTEINNHTDPNCPEGKKCTSAESDSNATSSQYVPVLGAETGMGQDPGPAPVAPSPDSSQMTSDLSALAKDPAALRQLMLESGVIKAEDLNKIDDATILQMAQGVVNQQFTSPTSTSSSPEL